jgi:AcrR family transcriptional regulator
MATSSQNEDRARAYHVGNVRTTLVDVAQALLREGGLAGLNLRDLSTRTGVALGSVYHHFGSKAELLAAMAAQGFTSLRTDLAKAADASDPRLVRNLVVAYFDFAWREPELYALMFQAPVARAPTVVAAREAAFQVFEQAILAAPAAQGRPAEMIHDIAVAVWTCAHGAASLAPIQDEGSDLVESLIGGLEALFRVGREYRAYPNGVQPS